MIFERVFIQNRPDLAMKLLVVSTHTLSRNLSVVNFVFFMGLVLFASCELAVSLEIFCYIP